ncbi:helix-turn-helix domain-containing protein [Actinoallomurus purpureus]|uniref:helix-turn-helix domain-containing protein n=1 Tax=Actinoallomurus purpureus TaxID=478114 RepID=UPI0020931EFC|nr:helix-turn-helix transcriptional regulator [Actinoallomurus purpureus]MCO6007078.1 helix-turn-helix domain-containing protein [Actinoallomurus purpureus]
MTPKSLSVRARRLATELKRRREAAGLTVEQAAAQLNWSYSKLIRFEGRRAIPKVGDVARILELYGVPGGDRDSLLQLAREAHQRGWWEDLGVFPGSYVGLEDSASLIRSWEPNLVAGLLQSEEYARAMIETGIPERGPEEVQRHVIARMARKTLLSRPGAPDFHAILGEAVLRQQVGGPKVQRDQLYALRSAAGRPNVTIQVLPYSAGASNGLEGGFVHLEFPDEIDPPISYMETLAGETYIESAEGNRKIRLAWDRVADAALSPEESVKLITDLAKE